MIISHDHEFIFFAVPKTATHSIREALRERGGDNQWEQQVLTGEQFLPIPELAGVRHGHLTALQAKAHLPPEIWNGYTKFAVVRNPYDRFVSACAFLNRNTNHFTSAPLAWMKSALQRPQFQQRVLIRPQAAQLCDERGLVAMDYVVRYENLPTSFNEVLQKLGLAKAELKKRNTSNHESWQNYYDAELKDAVTTLYQRDLDCFNYSF